MSSIIGVLSDTHGSLPGSVLELFKDVDCILHAGDIGPQAILTRLETIAPVRAVRGNMDVSHWGYALPQNRVVEIDGISFFILHDLMKLDINPEDAGIRIVVHGHTHRPSLRESGNVLYLNPGSAGHARFGSPETVARVTIRDGNIDIRFHELE